MRRLSRFGVCSGLFCVDFYTEYQISFPLTIADFYLTKKAGVILMSRTCSCSTVCMGTISHLALFQKCCRSSHGFGEHLSWFILSFWCNSRKCLDSEEKLDASQNILESKWYPLCNHCSDPWAPVTHLSLQKKESRMTCRTRKSNNPWNTVRLGGMFHYLLKDGDDIHG